MSSGSQSESSFDGRRIRLDISYDGTPFVGWAKQPGQFTVEGELERVIEIISGEIPDLTVAGRTDRGVHALGQVASYPSSSPPPLLRSLNALLPNQIAVHRSEVAPDGFDARRHATSRAYRYRVLLSKTPWPLELGRSLRWRGELDLQLLQSCAELLVGEHDFTAFTPTETYHVRFRRQVYCARWRREGAIFSFEIEADSFMHSMNRILVGTMLQVGSGERSLDNFKMLLQGRERAEAGVTAVPYGLYLLGVGYQNERVLG